MGEIQQGNKEVLAQFQQYQEELVKMQVEQQQQMKKLEEQLNSHHQQQQKGQDRIHQELLRANKEQKEYNMMLVQQINALSAMFGG